VTAAVPLGGRVAAGRVALVDDADAETAAAYRWHVKQNRPRRPGLAASGPYPITTLPRPAPGGRRTSPPTLTMTRLLTGWDRTLHLNGDPLDCRRANLVLAPQRRATRRAAA
jgi:hypothetical protein